MFPADKMTNTTADTIHACSKHAYFMHMYTLQTSLQTIFNDQCERTVVRGRNTTRTVSRDCLSCDVLSRGHTAHTSYERQPANTRHRDIRGSNAAYPRFLFELIATRQSRHGSRGYSSPNLHAGCLWYDVYKQCDPDLSSVTTALRTRFS